MTPEEIVKPLTDLDKKLREEFIRTRALVPHQWTEQQWQDWWDEKQIFWDETKEDYRG